MNYNYLTKFDHVNGNDDDMMEIDNLYEARRVMNRGQDCVRFFIVWVNFRYRNMTLEIRLLQSVINTL